MSERTYEGLGYASRLALAHPETRADQGGTLSVSLAVCLEHGEYVRLRDSLNVCHELIRAMDAWSGESEATRAESISALHALFDLVVERFPDVSFT